MNDAISNTIGDQFKEKVKTATGTLSSVVADKLAEREISRRTNLLIAGWDALEQANRELAKINKPDTKLRSTVDGSQFVEYFSDARHGQIQKAKSTVSELVSAIDVAIAEGQFERLEKCLKKTETKEPKAAE